LLFIHPRESNAGAPGAWTSGATSRGEIGAEEYLKRYGRGIGPKKCIKFAVLATRKGYRGFALGFWKKAFSLEHPNVPFYAEEMPASPEPTGSAKNLPDIFNT
jgi:hypothetical protein